MKRTNLRERSRRRGVSRLCGDQCGQLRRTSSAASIAQCSINGGAHLIRNRTNLWTILCGERPDPSEEIGQCAALAEE